MLATRRNRRLRAWAGFTLIELLVVVAIIALLMAVLLPSLAAAKDRSREVACAANMKGVGMGLQIYVSNNENYLPPFMTVTGGATFTVSPVVPYAGLEPWNGFSLWKHGGSTAVQAATSTPILPDALVLDGAVQAKNFECPNLTGLDGGGVGPGIKYAMSNFFFNGATPNNNFYQTKWAGNAALIAYYGTNPVRYSMIDYPAKGFVFADQQIGQRSAFTYPFAFSGNFPHGKTGLGRANTVMFDGHVESWNKTDFYPNLRASLPTGNNNWTSSTLWRPIEEKNIKKFW